MEKIHQLIQRSNTPPESVIELLENTLIGTEGSLYQLLDTRTKIHQLDNPHFLFLERNEKAIGNITICDRPIIMEGKHQFGHYIRYFAFDSIFQGSNEKGKSHGRFHEYFMALFNTSNLDPVHPKKEKSIYWAYIDPENSRSFKMNEKFAFQTIGQFTTKAFSRKNPKLIKGVRRVELEEQEHVLECIKHFYCDFNFFSKVHLFDNGDYFVYEYEGDIVAGIQANPTRFEIKSLSGFGGKILIKALPVLPGIKKLINPKEHKFLSTEGIFWKKGHQDKVQRLLEGVLYETSHHSLLMWIDDKNHMLETLDVKWGLIQKIKKNNPINIVAKFNGYGIEEINRIMKLKKYLSGFDMT